LRLTRTLDDGFYVNEVSALGKLMHIEILTKPVRIYRQRQPTIAASTIGSPPPTG